MKNINTKEISLEKRGKMRELIFVLLLAVLIFAVFSNFVAAQANSDQFKPYLHKPSLENVPKLEIFGEYQTELFQGAGTYNYDIEAPQGINGLQPFVSLLYSSQSAIQRLGMLGSGWSLTENNIMRNVNHTVNNTNDDYFILTLNNNRLKV